MVNTRQSTPLANRLRPQKLEEFFGQEKVTGKDSFLYQAIHKDQVPSIIFVAAESP